MKSIITPKEAVRIAVRYASLENTSFICEMLLNRDGLYELVLRTLLMRYEFYIDTSSGEVLGFNNEPGLFTDEAYCRLSA